MSDIQAQLSVLKQTADAEVVNAIHRLIEDGEDHELNRVNVLDFSRQHNLDEERAISGFLGIDDARVTDGSVTFKGRRIENRPPHEITRLGVVLVPERDKVFPNLTVAENLAAPFAPSAQGRSASEEFVYHSFPRLADLRRRTAGLLSGGERQMLALGSALVCRPELLLVDELSLGLAPAIVEELMARLVQIRRDLGLTMVLVEQNAAAALAVADYGYVLENGRCVLDGDSAPART